MKNIFPPWSNSIRPLIPLLAVGGLVYAILIVNYGFGPKALAVGYKPEQPVPFSHKMHAGELGLDCRYCHNTVERQPYAAIPATESCMACHKRIMTESPNLKLVRESWAKQEPIRWVKVHDLPDYAYFNHNAHVSKGVGCRSCHGRIDQMDVVKQTRELSMSWCLECHREPEMHLRPLDKITKMDWEQTSFAEGSKLRELHNVQTKQACSTCHR